MWLEPGRPNLRATAPVENGGRLAATMGLAQAVVGALAMLATMLGISSPPKTYIPIESGPVSMLLVSLDDIDLDISGDPLQHRKGGFFDAMSTAIEVANRQGIRVIAHVTAKSSLADVEAAVDARGLKVCGCCSLL